MSNISPLRTIFVTLLVISFGWGAGYIAFKSIEYFQPTTIIVETTKQTAATGDTTITDQQNVLTNASQVKQTGEAQENTLTIMVGGDVMFDRAIRAISERNGYDSLFADSIKALFARADIVVANLEGPITTNTSKTLVEGKTTNSFMFTFPPATTDALKSAGITIVSLANNHTDNFGFAGYQDTQRYLREAGIEWFGNPWNGTSTNLTLRTGALDSPVTTLIEKDGFTITLVGYHAFQLGVDRVVGEIRRVSGPDVFTIVMPHWGAEYKTVPSEKMRSHARAFISAGADAVIGAHPHIIAEQEWVGEVPVFYSVGNLLFDQYFSDAVKHGMIVELVLKQKSGTISIDHVTTHDTYIKPGVGVGLEK